MRRPLRIGAVLIGAVATFYFVLWVVGALLFGSTPPFSRHFLLAFGAAGLAGYLVWALTSQSRRGLLQAVVVGGFVVGGIAFAVGFFGPIIFRPDANQGPLLGLLITGPAGFLIGAVGGAIRWFIRRRAEASNTE